MVSRFDLHYRDTEYANVYHILILFRNFISLILIGIWIRRATNLSKTANVGKELPTVKNHDNNYGMTMRLGKCVI